MKKAILGSVLAVVAAGSMNAQAAPATICSGSAAPAAATVTGGTNFVKTTFTARCSSNVILVGEDAATYYQAGGASTKGKSRFGASSAGGGVTAGNCASATGCTSTDAATGATSTVTS